MALIKNEFRKVKAVDISKAINLMFSGEGSRHEEVVSLINTGWDLFSKEILSSATYDSHPSLCLNMALQVVFQGWLIFKVFPEVRTILVTKNSLRDQLTASLSGSSGWWSFFPLAPFQANSSLGLLPFFTGITAHKDQGNDSEWSHICFSLVYFSTNSTNQLRRQRTEMSNYCWQPAPKRNLRTSHRVTLWYCFFFFFFPCFCFVLFFSLVLFRV